MGEHHNCADQTGYVCGNSADEHLPASWDVADTLVPKEKLSREFSEEAIVGEKLHRKSGSECNRLP
jgi:hypothetical protein